MDERDKRFDEISDEYLSINNIVRENIKYLLNSYFYLHDKLGKVLDVGNGGRGPEHLFDKSVIDKNIDLFVGCDINYSMLKRANFKYRVTSDGFKLSFKNESFDSIIFLEIIHHFGLNEEQDNLDKFLQGVSNTLRKDGYIYLCEPTLPLFYEKLERFLFFIYRKMFSKRNEKIHIYMRYNKNLIKSIDRYYNRDIVITKKLHELVGGRFKMIAPFLFVKWFKLPASFIPYMYVFYMGRKKVN